MISERLGSRVRGQLLASIVCFCALACASVLTSRAAAQAQDDGNSAEYHALIDQALDEFKRKNWAEARVLFRNAHQLNPNARTLRGMGMVSYEMRDYVHAVLQLAASLNEGRQPLTDAQRKEVEDLLRRARTFVGAYALTLEPPGATVSLDGANAMRDAEGRVLVPMGEHQLRASAPGYLEETTKVTVTGGEQAELRIALSKPPAAGPLVATAAASAPPADPKGASAARSEPPVDGRFKLRYSWIALGATAAFGAAAAGTWFAGKGKLDELDDSCAQAAAAGTGCTRGSVDTGSVERLERTTNALLGLSAASLVTTVVLAALEWPRERRNLALNVGPQRLSLRGSF